MAVVRGVRGGRSERKAATMHIHSGGGCDAEPRAHCNTAQLGGGRIEEQLTA